MNQVYRDIEQHIPHLRRYARAIAYNPVAADDLVQECLTRALAKSHLFKPGTNLRAWLFAILHNQHVSLMRRDGKAGVPVDPEDVAPALATRPDQDRGLVMTALNKALRLLPEGQRILITLVAVDGLSYEEVAERFGLPVGTVKSRICRGRTALREALEGENGLGPGKPSRPRSRAPRRAATNGGTPPSIRPGRYPYRRSRPPGAAVRPHAEAWSSSATLRDSSS